MELTSKQRAYLRGLANDLAPFVQIGKEGITDRVAASARDAIEANELIKVNVQKNATRSVRDYCDELSERTTSQPVQCVGNRFVLYRPNKQRKIQLPPKN